MQQFGGRGLARRLRVAILGAVLGGTMLGFTAAPALADTNGTSSTEVFIVGDTELGYGEALTLWARVSDVSDSCENVGGAFWGCDWPYGRVDFYAVTGSTQRFMTSADLGAEPVIPETTTEITEYCCLPVGSYDFIRGYYVPNNFDPSSGQTGPVTVTRNGSTVTLEATPTTASVGQTISFKAHVAGYESDPNAIKPAGFVDVYEGATNYGTVAMDASGNATITTSQLTPGTHFLRARWPGDDRWTAATSSPVEVLVNGGAASSSLSASTTSTTYGANVTFTAGVSAVAPAVGIPSGEVTFNDGGVSGTEIGSAFLNEGTPNQATFTTNELSVGSHVIQAFYGGDDSFFSSTSNSVTVTVAKADTTTTVTSSANPSAFGAPVTFTAEVSGPGTTTATGTVQFKDGTVNIGSPQSLVTGTASLTLSTLAGGSHTIRAVYSGSASYNPSTSTPLTQTVACNQTITGTVGSVTTTAGTSTCLSGAKVSGSLTVASGSSLSIVNSTVTGNVAISGATSTATGLGATAFVTAAGGSSALTICGSTLGGNLKVTSMSGFVLVGDRLEDACAGNTIKGTVTLTRNTAGLALAENRIGGGVTVSNNLGSGPAGHTAPEVEANKIGGFLSAFGNSPAVTDDGRPNEVRGWAVYG